MKRGALFLDRDGVINLDRDYVHRVDDFLFMDGIFDTCRIARHAGYALVVVTNQAGIGRGYYTEQQFLDLSSWMRERFAAEGAPLAGIYHCPHHPVHGVGHYRQDCDCRKPNPGLLLRAALELQLDLADSIMVGDKASDIEAGRRAGVGTTILFGASATEVSNLEGPAHSIIDHAELSQFLRRMESSSC